MLDWLFRWFRASRHGELDTKKLLPPDTRDTGSDLRVLHSSFSGPMERIPQNRAEVYQIYGDPGTVAKPKGAFKKRLVVARDLPGLWNKGSGRLYVHELMEPYLREALRRCELVGCLDEITKMGCYVLRHQRHDAKRPLSYHSWGIAVDINPEQNRAKRLLAPVTPHCGAWRDLWPEGVSQRLVDAFKSVGFSWGGDWQGFVDPMHFELVMRPSRDR